MGYFIHCAEFKNSIKYIHTVDQYCINLYSVDPNLIRDMATHDGTAGMMLLSTVRISSFNSITVWGLSS